MLNSKHALIIPIGIVIAGIVLWSVNAGAGRRHEPIEYYRSWGGYVHPIVVYNKITRDEADAIATEGYAYLIAYFDDAGRLVHVTKMLRGAVFFDFEYTYHPNGRRKSARVTNANGVVTVREYDERGRDRPGNPMFW